MEHDHKRERKQFEGTDYKKASLITKLLTSVVLNKTEDSQFLDIQTHKNTVLNTLQTSHTVILFARVKAASNQ